MQPGVRRLGEHRQPGQAELRRLGHGEHERVEGLHQVRRVEGAVVGHPEPWARRSGSPTARWPWSRRPARRTPAGPSARRAPAGSVRSPKGSWIRAGTALAVSIERRASSGTPSCDPGKGVATSTAGRTPPGCRGPRRSPWRRPPRAAGQLVEVGDRQGGVGEDGGVARHEGQRVARRRTDRRAAPGGSLARSPQSTSAVVASAARSAVPTLPPSRTGGSASATSIAAEGVDDVRADAVAVGGELVEADHQHRAHPLGRAERAGAGGVRAQQLQGLGVGVGQDESRLAPTPVERP